MLIDPLRFQVTAVLVGNYKHDRLHGRGQEYADVVMSSAMNELETTGRLTISRHESKSGIAVVFHLDDGMLVEKT